MKFDAAKHNIALVVDDNPEALGMVATALEEIGMTVLVARDGNAAIELNQRVQPDVIMMDAVMPGLDGFETCRRLKSPPISTDAPIIFMTGLTDREHIVKGLSSGGVDYLTKPVEIEEMVARVTVHLMNSKMVRSAREALDSFGKSVLALTETGEVAWGSPKAMETLGTLGSTEAAAALAKRPVVDWLEKVRSLPVSQSPSLEFDNIRLQFIGRSSSGELLVKLSTVSDQTAQAFLAQKFDLTQREGEVLLWLAQGKTNRDIAQILDLSARTVNKHLEQIFQKMGVDNRTSAAVMADRLLHS